MTDPAKLDGVAAKARHGVLMLLSAQVVTGLAREQAPYQALGRHTVLWADTSLLWLRRWRNELARSPDRATSAAAARLKTSIAAMEALFSPDVRDFLGAKRQASAISRADDLRYTAALWSHINPHALEALARQAAETYDGLNGVYRPGAAPIFESMGLPFAVHGRIAAALPKREKHWYFATDTAAELRPYTVPAAQGGDLGRVIAQINDVAMSLDALLRIAPHVYGFLPYDWLVRSSLLTDVAALLNLVFGSLDVGGPLCLRDLCRYGRPREAGRELDRLEASIPRETREMLRWWRNKLGAHIDDETTLFHLREHLVQLDYRGVVRVVEHVLNWLDVLGTDLDLKLLLFGERRINSWPIATSRGLPGRPDPRGIPGALARLFETIDSPYMAAAASSLATGALSGATLSRQPRPRKPVSIPARPGDRFSPKPPPRIILPPR